MALTTLPSAAFASGSVGTAQLADGAVTTEKLVADVNFRNIIINGDMSIAQRGTSASSVATGYNTIDRFAIIQSNSSANWNESQSTDVPTSQGFSNSWKLLVSTGGAIASNQRTIIRQRFEGQNLQYLKKGTSSAESVTTSFWVKSSTTGTYICQLRDNDNNRSISKSYTINSANTWEKKTITFAGDTTGALDNDNGASLDIWWWLDAGTNYSSGTLQTSWGTLTDTDSAVSQTNLGATTNNDFYITGVQLEVGTSASDFEFLPYDVNVRRCQRYYCKSFPIGTTPADGAGGSLGSTNSYAQNYFTVGLFHFPVVMRVNPTVTFYNPSVSSSNKIQDASGGNYPAYVQSLNTLAVGCGVSGTNFNGGGTYGFTSFTAEAEL